MRSRLHTFLNTFRWLDFLFYFFILLILAGRVALFLQLNLDHIDSDQPLMWLGASHFSEGLFYEPRYYGQNYNTLMEALLAVPFMKLGMPVYYAVPIVTHLLFLAPFLFTACYLFALNKKPQALLVLIILLCMPSGYDIMNAIPRGFVTGIFFTTPFILSIHDPASRRYILLNTFCACLAYLVNQNSLLVSIPFLFYLFLHNYQSKKYYAATLIGVGLALPVAYLLNHFYVIHPDYVKHDFQNHFSVYYFKDAISNLDRRFAHINFFVDQKCIWILLVLFLSGVLLFKQNKKAFYTYLLFIGFIFISFFSSKIADGVAWPFYSYSRMYLGVPVVLYLLLSLISIHSQKILYTLAALVVLFTGYKELNLEKNIAYHTDNKKWFLVQLTSLKEISGVAHHYKGLCEETGVNDFVVINDIWFKEELCYGGPALYKDFPNTLMSLGERRTWRITEERKRIPERFMILTTDFDLDKKGFDTLHHFKITRIDYYGCFLIENNTKTLPAFLDAIGSPVNDIKEN